MVSEALGQLAADASIRKYRTSELRVYRFLSAGTPDRFGQAVPVYDGGTVVIGRAFHDPTQEQVTFIGDGERYGAAFVFSRLQLLKKFPALAEGKWITTYDRITWKGNEYKLDKVQPAGLIGETFSVVVALGNTPEGGRVS